MGPGGNRRPSSPAASPPSARPRTRGRALGELRTLAAALAGLASHRWNETEYDGASHGAHRPMAPTPWTVRERANGAHAAVHGLPDAGAAGALGHLLAPSARAGQVRPSACGQGAQERAMNIP